MMAWKIGPALATGCAIVLKPSEFTPREIAKHQRGKEMPRMHPAKCVYRIFLLKWFKGYYSREN